MFEDPLRQGILCETAMLLDQVLLPQARLRQAGVVQPLDVIQAQALRFQALLVCSTSSVNAANWQIQLFLSQRVRAMRKSCHQHW